MSKDNFLLEVEKISPRDNDIVIVSLVSLDTDTVHAYHEWFRDYARAAGLSNTQLLIVDARTDVSLLSDADLAPLGLIRAGRTDTLLQSVGQLASGAIEKKDWVLVRREDWDHLKSAMQPATATW